MPKCLEHLKPCAAQLERLIQTQEVSNMDINTTEPMQRFDRVLSWTHEHLLTMPQFIFVLERSLLTKWLALIHKQLNSKDNKKIEHVWNNIYDVWRKKKLWTLFQSLLTLSWKNILPLL